MVRVRLGQTLGQGIADLEDPLMDFALLKFLTAVGAEDVSTMIAVSGVVWTCRRKSQVD